MAVKARNEITLVKVVDGTDGAVSYTHLKSIASSAKTTEKSLKAMKSSISFVNSALEGLGSLAKSAIKSLISSFSNAEGKAKTAGQNIGNNISSGCLLYTSSDYVEISKN